MIGPSNPSELFAGRGTEVRRIRRLLEPMAKLDVDVSIAERAGRLRRSTHIRLPDATALEHRLTLVTRKVRNFGSVKGLRLREP